MNPPEPPPEPPPLRVGHADREWAVAELGEHLAQGRLDPDEYADRAGAAYAARTRDELDVLFADLPRPAAPVAPVAYPAPYPAGRPDAAPYGIDPRSGVPYSDRSKVVAGVLQLVLPFGVGRFYSGHHGIAVGQLLLSIFLIGAIWAFVDGIVLLAGHPTDPYGRPLRP
ncbi:DUF1707 domain-containing protein [Pseudonocardia petroleophila]|uniref:DUF1707 domain-containing protein n=1 Tax=Pseudonocardia petroleophila TaxID=37331 RepID=UPI002103CDAD|nr:DUF1707 domain-containing protein [Pseudonocardia petroleophila]